MLFHCLTFQLRGLLQNLENAVRKWNEVMKVVINIIYKKRIASFHNKGFRIDFLMSQYCL